MFRHLLTAALLAAPAFAAAIDPGRTPGLSLLLDGLPGAANEVAAAPPLTIKLRDTALTLETSTLADVVKLAGGEVYTAGESENAFAWLCYASPDANSGGATLTWFYATDTETQTLVGIAQEFAPDEVSDYCARLDAPLDLTTGLPGLGAPVADLDAVFGKATADSGEPGTASYMFGGESRGEGRVARTEAKYVSGDSHVLAFSILAFVEQE